MGEFIIYALTLMLKKVMIGITTSDLVGMLDVFVEQLRTAIECNRPAQCLSELLHRTKAASLRARPPLLPGALP